MKDLKFFDETFKILLAIAVSIWAIFAALILFVDDRQGCVSGAAGGLFTVMAIIAGVMSAPPLLYGLARLLWWPNGAEGKGVWAAGTVILSGVGFFVAAAVAFAITVSHFGCR
jgi:hypothetical protein